jgi:hypothetical protein
VFGVVDVDQRGLLVQQLAVFTGEKEAKIEELLPVWEAILLGGLLKLVRNRIRFNALYNFILQKPIPEQRMQSFLSSTNGIEMDEILRYGEGMMGILIPDKKSAIAMILSRSLNCKSSSFLKGLSVVFSLYGLRLKEVDYPALKDWKSFGEYFIDQKDDLNALCSTKVLLAISEIMLLSDILKLEMTHLDHMEDDREIPANRFQLKHLIYVIGILLVSGLVIWYTNFRADEEILMNPELEELIPVDSLTKLNDSLTRAVLDSNALKNDSISRLTWPDGSLFEVPKKSILVSLHTYLLDSTALAPLELLANEVHFDVASDALPASDAYLFKLMASALNKSKQVDVKVVAFSDSGDKLALKRGFIVKNRLVGEGLSQKRIEVSNVTADYAPDPSFASSNQVLFIFSKKTLLK